MTSASVGAAGTSSSPRGLPTQPAVAAAPKSCPDLASQGSTTTPDKADESGDIDMAGTTLSCVYFTPTSVLGVVVLEKPVAVVLAAERQAQRTLQSGMTLRAQRISLDGLVAQQAYFDPPSSKASDVATAQAAGCQVLVDTPAGTVRASAGGSGEDPQSFCAQARRVAEIALGR